MSNTQREWSITPRVLVVDDEELPRNDLAINLRRWGMLPILATGRGAGLLEDARRLARQHRCHIAIVDMRLIDHQSQHDISGLLLVKDLLPTLSIIYSGRGNDVSAARALRERGAVDFISKGQSPDDLKAALLSVLREYCGLPITTAIAWPGELSSAAVVALFFPERTDVPPSEADELLARLFPRARSLRMSLIGDQSRTPSLAPRQRSVVLTVIEDDLQPVVVKIARAERIETERMRYAAYVRGRLGGLHYADLDDARVLWDLGGARYVYMGAGLERMRSFSEYYAQSPAPRIGRTLKRLFAETWGSHYISSREPCDCSLLEAYATVWDSNWLQRLRTVPDNGPWLTALPGLPHSLPEPVRWVREATGLDRSGPDRSALAGLTTAITHGDMLGDNIFVDEHQVAWLIDFERTGRGPVLQDFVELEVDILTRLTAFAPGELATFAELAACLVRGPTLTAPLRGGPEHPAAARAIPVIGGLRRLAAHLCDAQSLQPYLWGLLLNTIFRATLLRDTEANEPQRQRALVLGALICRQLDILDRRQGKTQ